MGTQYSDRVVEGMQALYGRGFLSPGGPDEMAVLLDGVDLAGDTILDIGCGLGGAAVMLAGEFGARHVTSIDIAEDLVTRTTVAIRSAGLAERVNAIHVTPGPLPFGDAAFDVVFAKDVVCHMEDKEALFGEAARVLRPGGRVVCADFIVPGRTRRAASSLRRLDRCHECLRPHVSFRTARRLSRGIPPGRPREYHDS